MKNRLKRRKAKQTKAAEGKIDRSGGRKNRQKRRKEKQTEATKEKTQTEAADPSCLLEGEIADNDCTEAVASAFESIPDAGILLGVGTNDVESPPKTYNGMNTAVRKINDGFMLNFLSQTLQ